MGTNRVTTKPGILEFNNLDLYILEFMKKKTGKLGILNNFYMLNSKIMIRHEKYNI